MIPDILNTTKQYVKKVLQHAEAGHDWFHIERVFNNTNHILKTIPEADILVCQLAALLHDIADSKFNGGDETIGPIKAKEFLQNISIPQDTIDKVVFIIENMSFRNSLDQITRNSIPIELSIVQDADRLDAIGAIGIARAFHFGGYKNRIMYDPSVPPKIFNNKEEYKNNEGTTLNHFYEKLILLKDSMQTESGKRMAQIRHDFMMDFLNQFLSEWNASNDQ